KVCARQLPRVVGRLQESNRALDLAERGTWLALHQGKPGQRPVEANARVGIGRLLRSPERFPYDHTRAPELAEVGEGIAQIRREPNLGAHVLGRDRKSTRLNSTHE